MHRLVNRAIQCFVADTYGADVWARIAARAVPGNDGFDALETCDDALTDAVLAAAAADLGRPRETVLEDLGTYLVSHPKRERLRRLLRFGGASYVDFLQSLHELPARARMAVPDLDLPPLDLRDGTPPRFALVCDGRLPGFGHVLVGVLRAMADDYGALVLLDHAGAADGVETITIDLLDARHATGRRFALSAAARP